MIFAVLCFFALILSTVSASLSTSKFIVTNMSNTNGYMNVITIANSQKTYPSGDPKFSVMQPFPAGIPAEKSDPFLMCDRFGPTVSKGVTSNPDEFPMAWHPHRGMDILSYITEGTGRHADSLGNRGTFESPGMQWISVGSGIEHAEGGGTAAGSILSGFQIWINVPSVNKMDTPRYGTEPPENIPIFSDSLNGMSGRLLAGEMTTSFQTGNSCIQGPFKTVADVQIVDYVLDAGGKVSHTVPTQLDNVLVYIYNGSGSVLSAGSEGGSDSVLYDIDVYKHQVIHFDGSDSNSRVVSLTADDNGLSCMVFSGKKLKEKIAWHGPFVMNTDEEIRNTITEYQTGRFLRHRVPWDYKTLSSFPKNHPAHSGDLSGV